MLLSAEKVTGDGGPEGLAEGLPGALAGTAHSRFCLETSVFTLICHTPRSAKLGQLSWILPPPTLFLAVLS